MIKKAIEDINLITLLGNDGISRFHITARVAYTYTKTKQLGGCSVALGYVVSDVKPRKMNRAKITASIYNRPKQKNCDHFCAGLALKNVTHNQHKYLQGYIIK